MKETADTPMRGQPPIYGRGQTLDSQINVMCTRGERERFKMLAKELNTKVGRLARQLLNDLADKKNLPSREKFE